MCYKYYTATVTHHLGHFHFCLLYQTCANAEHPDHDGKNPQLSYKKIQVNIFNTVQNNLKKVPCNTDSI